MNPKITPTHYGGQDNLYEAIKVIEAHNLNFSTGNAIKYILRHPYKCDPITDLKKAIKYLQFEVERLEKERQKKIDESDCEVYH